MGFQWDVEKDKANQAKHLLSFRQAAEIFRGVRLTREDTRRPYGERRFVALGEYDGQLVKVVYTLRDDDIRSISAWKASRYDREDYVKARTNRQVRQS